MSTAIAGSWRRIGHLFCSAWGAPSGSTSFAAAPAAPEQGQLSRDSGPHRPACGKLCGSQPGPRCLLRESLPQHAVRVLCAAVRALCPALVLKGKRPGRLETEPWLKFRCRRVDVRCCWRGGSPERSVNVPTSSRGRLCLLRPAGAGSACLSPESGMIPVTLSCLPGQADSQGGSPWQCAGA